MKAILQFMLLFFITSPLFAWQRYEYPRPELYDDRGMGDISVQESIELVERVLKIKLEPDQIIEASYWVFSSRLGMKRSEIEFYSHPYRSYDGICHKTKSRALIFGGVSDYSPYELYTDVTSHTYIAETCGEDAHWVFLYSPHSPVRWMMSEAITKEWFDVARYWLDRARNNPEDCEKPLGHERRICQSNYKALQRVTMDDLLMFSQSDDFCDYAENRMVISFVEGYGEHKNSRLGHKFDLCIEKTETGYKLLGSIL